MLLVSRYQVNRVLTILSKVLHMQLVSAIGLKLLGEVRSLSGLGRGIMVASDHEGGKSPVCQILLNSSRRMYCDVSGRCLSIW